MPRVKKDNTNRLYFSARLTSKLEGILTAKTTLIAAPAGYGKTTAARDFFSKRLPKGATLLWLTCIDEPAGGAWKRFSRIIQKIDAEVGSDLLGMGLPDEDTKGDVASLLMEMNCAEETYLVMDDFQYIKSAAPDTVWNTLMEHGAKYLHTVILTRTPVEQRMALKPGVLALGQDVMRLTESEIGEYFKQAGITLTPGQVREVNRHTEGWIAALYLQMKSYADTGSVIHTTDIYQMIREIVWDKLTGAERGFLLRVSPFDSYTFKQAAHMMREKELPEYAKALSYENGFIQQDPLGLLFRPHSTLLDFMREVFGELPENERQIILNSAGDWCAENGQPEQAMYFYYRLGAYEKILSLDVLGMEFEQMDKTKHTDMLLEVLENTTPEAKLAHSVCVLKIIFMLFGPGCYEQFGRWCAEMSAIAAENDLPELEKTRLSGELALLASFTKYNNIAEMGSLMHSAHELLGGRPSLISMTDAWTFGNASVLFMYHAKTGRLDAELADMDENCVHYFALTQGHGSGGDVLMKAEAHFNRGEMEDAAVLAHKALYQAENKRQESVAIGAALLLGRLAVYRGDYDGIVSILEQRIARYAAQNPLKSNRMEADLAVSFLTGLIDRPQEMAEWLRNGDINEKRLFSMSIPYAQILFGKYMIQTGRSEIWLGMESGAHDLANMLRCRMADIYGGILTAAAWRAQGKHVEAAAALRTALDAALPDRLYMPFAENRTLLGALLDEHCPSAALKEILAFAEKQEAGKMVILRELYPPLPFGLTEREYEVARLAVQSLTIPQIADKLMIARSTAKGYMKNIYQKLQVSSRSELNNILEKK